MNTIHAEQIPPETSARDFLDSLGASQEEIVYVQGGTPRLLLSPARVLAEREAAKREFFRKVDELRARNAGVDSDDVLRELEELDHDR
jgi:hypothetical protein